jgi:hypothetical protein
VYRTGAQCCNAEPHSEHKACKTHPRPGWKSTLTHPELVAIAVPNRLGGRAAPQHPATAPTHMDGMDASPAAHTHLWVCNRTHHLKNLWVC